MCNNNSSNYCRQAYLAGSFRRWLTTEIEVFKLTESKESYSSNSNKASTPT